jgi:putative addiction module killer protein
MNTIISTREFDQWLSILKDSKARARITARILSAQLGNFGDIKTLGHGIWEMRIHVGPGYRVYYSRRGDVFYLLLCAGDKSTQKHDIRHAGLLLSQIDGDTEHD